jgi:hypothetical protein
MAINYFRLGKAAAGWKTVAVLVLVSVALLAFAVVVPDTPFIFLVGIPLFVVLWIAAKVLQGPAYDEHLRHGGRAASGGSAVGFGLLGMLLYLGIVLGGGFLYDILFTGGLGEKLVYGRGEELYYKGVPKEDADRLGRFLQAQGYFNNQGGKTVVLAREEGRLIMSIVLVANSWNNPQAIQEFRQFSQMISQQVFSGQPVQIRLCDEHLRVQRTLP